MTNGLVGLPDGPCRITPRQRQVLESIVAIAKRLGYPPTIRELQELLGMASPYGVIDHLRRLAAKGLLRREVATARAICLTPLGNQMLRNGGHSSSG